MSIFARIHKYVMVAWCLLPLFSISSWGYWGSFQEPAFLVTGYLQLPNERPYEKVIDPDRWMPFHMKLAISLSEMGGAATTESLAVALTKKNTSRLESYKDEGKTTYQSHSSLPVKVSSYDDSALSTVVVVKGIVPGIIACGVGPSQCLERVCRRIRSVKIIGMTRYGTFTASNGNLSTDQGSPLIPVDETAPDSKEEEDNESFSSDEEFEEVSIYTPQILQKVLEDYKKRISRRTRSTKSKAIILDYAAEDIFFSVFSEDIENGYELARLYQNWLDKDAERGLSESRKIVKKRQELELIYLSRSHGWQFVLNKEQNYNTREQFLWDIKYSVVKMEMDGHRCKAYREMNADQVAVLTESLLGLEAENFLIKSAEIKGEPTKDLYSLYVNEYSESGVGFGYSFEWSEFQSLLCAFILMGVLDSCEDVIAVLKRWRLSNECVLDVVESEEDEPIGEDVPKHEPTTIQEINL